MADEQYRPSLNETRAQAAERFLERKRIGLESAIEALEVVGYSVQQDVQGSYRVSPPRTSFGMLNSNDDERTTGVSDEFLDGYPPLLTVKEVAAILGVSSRTVSRLCEKGEIPSSKIGRAVRIPKKALLEYMS